MKKKFDDMIQIKKLKAIERPVLELRKKGEREREEGEPKKDSKKIIREALPKSGKREKGLIKIVAKVILAIALLLLILGGFSAIYSRADVALEPRIIPSEVSGDFKAYKNAKVGDINFQVMSVSVSKPVPKSGISTSEKKVKASGTATIFNSGNSPQILIAGTRLEKPDGHVYKIRKNVTVPASKISNGKKVPGSIDVLADASDFGIEYNFSINDSTVEFSIPGLKNYPEKYRNVIAKAKTDFSGGSGLGTIITGGGASEINIKSELLSQAVEKVKAEVPEGYVYFDGGFANESLKYESSPTNNDEMMAVFSIDAAFFDKKTLISRIAEDDINQERWNGKEIKLDSNNLSDLQFSFVKKPTELKTIEAINFKLSGSYTLKGEIDEKEVKFALAGSGIDKINSILKNFPEINKADIIIKPFWKRSIPKDIEKIKILQKLD